MVEQKRVVAKSVRPAKVEINNREQWATICYYYPQYTLEEASKLTLRDIRLLLKIAEKLRAKEHLELLKISTAPHTEKGKGIKQAQEEFERIAQQ